MQFIQDTVMSKSKITSDILQFKKINLMTKNSKMRKPKKLRLTIIQCLCSGEDIIWCQYSRSFVDFMHVFSNSCYCSPFFIESWLFSKKIHVHFLFTHTSEAIYKYFQFCVICLYIILRLINSFNFLNLCSKTHSLQLKISK